MNLASKVLKLLEADGMALPKDFTVKGFQAKLIEANKKMNRQIAELSKNADDESKKTVEQLKETVKQNSESIGLLNTLSDDLSNLSAATATVIFKQADSQIVKISQKIESIGKAQQEFNVFVKISEKSAQEHQKGIEQIRSKLNKQISEKEKISLEKTLTTLEQKLIYVIRERLGYISSASALDTVLSAKSNELKEWQNFANAIVEKASQQVADVISDELKKILRKIKDSIGKANKSSDKREKRVLSFNWAEDTYNELVEAGVRDVNIEKALEFARNGLFPKKESE
jgi:hypothetical protein